MEQRVAEELASDADGTDGENLSDFVVSLLDRGLRPVTASTWIGALADLQNVRRAAN
jgi:hypothetical protein